MASKGNNSTAWSVISTAEISLVSLEDGFHLAPPTQEIQKSHQQSLEIAPTGVYTEASLTVFSPDIWWKPYAVDVLTCEILIHHPSSIKRLISLQSRLHVPLWLLQSSITQNLHLDKRCLCSVSIWGSGPTAQLFKCSVTTNSLTSSTCFTVQAQETVLAHYWYGPDECWPKKWGKKQLWSIKIQV